MQLLDNLNILIVNSDIVSRSVLRDVLKSFLYKVEIIYSRDLKEAVQLIKGDSEIDVGFVAFEFGKDEIAQFVRSINSMSSKSAPPIIATLKTRGEGSTLDITKSYPDGVNGFISEPYSSDDILKLLKVCAEIREKLKVKDKLKKASSLLLQETKLNIDKLVKCEYMQVEGKDVSVQKNLANLQEGLKSLYEQDKEQYTEALIQAFENSKPPTKIERVVKRKIKAKNTEHPGKIISELMQKRNISFEKIENSLKMEKADFERLLNCQHSIDDRSSREIARIFGKTSREWLQMQKDYDAYAVTLQEEKN